MKNLLFLMVMVALSGCTSARERTTSLELGMSKQQVVDILGKPDSSSADIDKGECYIFSLWRDFWNRKPGDYSDRYYTCFKEDKLVSFGREDE